MGAVVGVVGVLGRAGVGVRCSGRSQCCCSSSPGRQGMRALKHSGGRRDQQRCRAGAAGCSGVESEGEWWWWWQQRDGRKRKGWGWV